MNASLVALAGTITAVLGLLLWTIVPPIGLFFVALGAAIALASPAVGLVRWWDGRRGGSAE